MTLTKIKPRRAPPANKLRLGQHHHHSNNYLKTYWPYLPIALVIGLGFAFNNWIGQQNKSVLGYATDMSVQSLLDDTNAQRIANGEAPLTINAQLDQAAQAKADNMAARIIGHTIRQVDKHRGHSSLMPAMIIKRPVKIWPTVLILPKTSLRPG